MALPVTTVLILVKERLTYDIYWNKQSFNCFLETGHSAIIDRKDYKVVTKESFVGQSNALGMQYLLMHNKAYQVHFLTF